MNAVWSAKSAISLVSYRTVGLPVLTRCQTNQQIRGVRSLSRDETIQARDDFIRKRLSESPVAVVEEVIKARNEIWDGLSGGVLMTFRSYTQVMTDS